MPNSSRDTGLGRIFQTEGSAVLGLIVNMWDVGLIMLIRVCIVHYSKLFQENRRSCQNIIYKEIIGMCYTLLYIINEQHKYNQKSV